MPAPRCRCFCCLSAVAPARVGRHASFVWHVGAWQHKCVCAAVATRHGDGTCAPAPTGTRLTRDHARAIHALDSPPGEAHRQSTCSHTRAPYCICSDVQHQPARIERDDRERDESEDDHRAVQSRSMHHPARVEACRCTGMGNAFIDRLQGCVRCSLAWLGACLS